MSSTPMSTPTALRRVATVRSPRLKRRAPTTRKCWRPTCMRSPGLPGGGVGRVLLQLLARDDDGADERGEEDEGGELEGEQPLGEEAVSDLARGGREPGRNVGGPGRRDGHEDEHRHGRDEQRHAAAD